jgi:hypothetical protein
MYATAWWPYSTTATWSALLPPEASAEDTSCLLRALPALILSSCGSFVSMEPDASMTRATLRPPELDASDSLQVSAFRLKAGEGKKAAESLAAVRERTNVCSFIFSNKYVESKLSGCRQNRADGTRIYLSQLFSSSTKRGLLSLYHGYLVSNEIFKIPDDILKY